MFLNLSAIVSIHSIVSIVSFLHTAVHQSCLPKLKC
jgi:hypothetical protein